MIDEALVGRVLDTVTFPVDRSGLAALARALHDEDPVWHDPAAAAAAGFDHVPSPPTATVMADHRRAHGIVEHCVRVGMDLGRVLHAEASWELQRGVRPGDVLEATTTVESVTRRQGRRGGAMTFVVFATAFTDAAGEPVARVRHTFVETGATER